MDEGTLDGLIPLVYGELRRLASLHLKRERKGHTLQTTALVHEAYLRLRGQHATWSDTSHVLGIAASQMRRVLVDHARARNSQKRNAGLLVASTDTEQPGVEVLTLNAALDELATLDVRQAQIVELRYFGGLTVDETAAIMALSAATVNREWAMARAWLKTRMDGGGGAHGS